MPIGHLNNTVHSSIMKSYEVRVPTTVVDEFASRVHPGTYRSGTDLVVYHSVIIPASDHFRILEAEMFPEHIEQMMRAFCNKYPQFKVPGHTYREYQFSPHPFTELVKAPNIITLTLIHTFPMKNVPSYLTPVPISNPLTVYMAIGQTSITAIHPESDGTRSHRESFKEFKQAFVEWEEVTVCTDDQE
jgi:hypothetical protein